VCVCVCARARARGGGEGVILGLRLQTPSDEFNLVLKAALKVGDKRLVTEDYD
jgi:hypothetical protein